MATKSEKASKTPGTDVDVKRFQAPDLETFAQYAELFQNSGIEIIEAGDGFELLPDTDTIVKRLEGVPFLALEYRTIESDKFFRKDGTPAKYAFVKGITEKNERFKFTVGGAGVPAQLDAIDARRVGMGQVPGTAVLCPRGVTLSEYTYEDDHGNDVPASTLYIAE